MPAPISNDRTSVSSSFCTSAFPGCRARAWLSISVAAQETSHVALRQRLGVGAFTVSTARCPCSRRDGVSSRPLPSMHASVCTALVCPTEMLPSKNTTSCIRIACCTIWTIQRCSGARCSAGPGLKGPSSSWIYGDRTRACSWSSWSRSIHAQSQTCFATTFGTPCMLPTAPKKYGLSSTEPVFNASVWRSFPIDT